MATTTVRVSEEAAEALRGIAEQRSEPMSTILEQLILDEEDRLFWAASNMAFLNLRSDPVAWEREQEFRRELEGTLMDGLNAEERVLDR